MVTVAMMAATAKSGAGQQGERPIQRLQNRPWHTGDEARRELLPAHASVDSGGAASDLCPSCGQFTGPGHRCPVPAGLPAADYSQSRGETRTQKMLADLQTAVQPVVHSGQLQRWLDAMASNGCSTDATPATGRGVNGNGGESNVQRNLPARPVARLTHLAPCGTRG